MKKLLYSIIIAIAIPLSAFADPSPSPTPPPDKLNTALADMVNKSVQVAGDAKDFLVAQLPDVVRQLLMWKAAEAGAKGLILVALSALLAWCAVRAIKWGVKEDEEVGFVAGVFCVAGGAAIAFAAFNYALTVLQIWIAPKIYLIEYSKAFITGH